MANWQVRQQVRLVHADTRQCQPAVPLRNHAILETGRGSCC
ncbi:hypothetical protein PSNTI_31540 [Stutzerimonas stutzeri]|nr:hypothetical protein PSNTI_31540 [Stutzerimonas stutzeri]